ncbi:hypothetical protein Ae201684_006132 [Aphanomyces euteiches]|uniref:Uncharacterized protein n=1 Tax=Aphanomyces euteiches TaxID=100861 RepID=A0A6G0XD70_9STRA|nr:hypothetical protein Ae201684_006132 [Aphanomyces euteiches]
MPDALPVVLPQSPMASIVRTALDVSGSLGGLITRLLGFVEEELLDVDPPSLEGEDVVPSVEGVLPLAKGVVEGADVEELVDDDEFDPPLLPVDDLVNTMTTAAVPAAASKTRAATATRNHLRL